MGQRGKKNPPDHQPQKVMLTHWVALLRAVNVGGAGKLPMADLRKLCENLDFQNVSTYIQSGNLVFSAPGEATGVAGTLQTAIADRFGIDTHVLLRTPQQWENVIVSNPFAHYAESAPSKLLVSFLNSQVDPSLESELQSLVPGGEELRLGALELYLYFPMGMGQSKLNITRIERKLGTVSTARNWNTVRKLHDMAKSLDSH